MRQKLLEVERTAKEPRTTCVAIVLVERDHCLRCGSEDLEKIVVGQLPLLRHGGYGAVRQTTITLCNEPCGWSFVSDITEVRPPRRDEVA